MILWSDNGSGVILINTTDYVPKMKSILSDHMKFRLDKSNKELTDSIDKRITNVLRDLLKKKMVDNFTSTS